MMSLPTFEKQDRHYMFTHLHKYQREEESETSEFTTAQSSELTFTVEGFI